MTDDLDQLKRLVQSQNRKIAALERERDAAKSKLALIQTGRQASTAERDLYHAQADANAEKAQNMRLQIESLHDELAAAEVDRDDTRAALKQISVERARYRTALEKADYALPAEDFIVRPIIRRALQDD